MRDPEAYRPVSILNADYKSLTTLLANRLNSIIGGYVNHNQMGFIWGRFLKDDVKKVMNIVYWAQADSIPRVLLFLDAEKSFDMIEWQYSHYAVKQFGAGDNFQTWLQLLYKDQSAVSVYEGQASEKISLNHGDRQGCPLSPLLFTLVLEPAIRKNVNIAGFHISRAESKITLYTDDNACFLEIPVLTVKELCNLIIQFGSISGYKINERKSYQDLIFLYQ